MYLQGFYSGYNGTIYCHDTVVCNIHCYANGCTNLNLICGSINNPIECNNNTNSMYVVYCDETHGVICPNGWNSSILSSYYYNYELLETVLTDVDYNTNSKLDYIEKMYYSECNESNVNKNDHQCGNYNEYNSGLFVGNDNICCTGVYACIYSRINTFGNVFCDGNGACWFATIDGVIDGYNYGNIYGRARYSMHSSTIRNFNSIIASGESSGSSVTAVNGSFIACLAHISCGSVTFTSVKNIYSGGYESINSGNINSGGIGEMNVFFLGYKSGSNTNIICNNNDTCRIYCVISQSCDELGSISCDSNNLCQIIIVNTTNNPTTSPTTIPSLTPTAMPTTNRPTTLPTIYPSLNPTHIPFGDDSTMIEVVVSFNSQFTNDFLYIITNINISVGKDGLGDNLKNSIDVVATKFDCNDIFDRSTSILLSNNAKCEWKNNNLTILVTLSGYSLISINDSLIINKNAFLLKPVDSNSTVHVVNHYNISNHNSSDVYQLTNILCGDNPIRPEIVISDLVTQIGICDDIIVDARNTYNLGGRQAQYNWTFELQGKGNRNSIDISDLVLSQLQGPKITFTFEQLSEFVLLYVQENTSSPQANSNSSHVGIIFTLNVETWYGGKQIKIINITRVDDEKDVKLNPMVSIDGPSYFTIDNNNYNFNHVILYANFKVLSNFSCLEKQINLNNYNYSRIDDVNNDNNVTFNWQIQWSVNGVNNTNVNDLNHLNKINEYLSNNNNNNNNMNDRIIIPSNLLVAGNTYQFIVQFECNLTYLGVNIECIPTQTRHSMIYDYSSITCQITGGNSRKISNVSINWFYDSSLKIYLDVDTFTYDIDMFKSSNNIFNKSHLLFAWSCNRSTTIIEFEEKIGTYTTTVFIDDCGDLVQQATSAETSVTLTLATNFTDQEVQQVEFEFEMIVSDSRQYLNRSECVTTQILTIDNIYHNNSEYTSDRNALKWLDVSLTAMQTQINRNERLRLITDVNFNYNCNYDWSSDGDDNCQCIYQYSELNGHLTQEYINNHRIGVDNSFNSSKSQSNLILEANSLDNDIRYIFNVDVFCTDSEDRTFKGSANLEIYVKQVPTVVDGTFSVEPDCNNITVNTFDQLIDLTFDLSVDALLVNNLVSLSNLALTYQFSYLGIDLNLNQGCMNRTILLNTYPSTNSFLDNVRLPIGTFLLQVTVFDLNGNFETIPFDNVCNIRISLNDDDGGGIDTGNGEYIEKKCNVTQSINNLIAKSLLSTNEKYTFVFQTVAAAISYFGYIDCRIANIIDLFDLIAHTFGSSRTDLCQTRYVAVKLQIVLFVCLNCLFWYSG